MEKCKTLGEVLDGYGFRGALKNRIILGALKDLTRKGLIDKDNKVTATEEEFADTVVAQVPKRELLRLEAEGKIGDGNTVSRDVPS